MKRVVVTAVMILTFALPAFAEPLEDALFDLAREIGDSVKEQKKRKIAILPFDEAEGKKTVLAGYVPEMLVTNLFVLGRFEIVERQMLDKVVGELRRQNKEGGFDPKTAAQVGRLAGVEAIVTGTITDFPQYIGISCRVIDTETGTVFGAAKTTITKDDNLRAVMNTAQAPPVGKAPSTGSTDGADVERPSHLSNYAYTEVESATRRGDVVSLTIGVQSRHTESRNYWLGSVYLLDDNGERWGCRFENGTDSESFELHPRTKRKLRATCRPVGDASGTRFTLLSEHGGVSSIEDIMPVAVKK